MENEAPSQKINFLFSPVFGSLSPTTNHLYGSHTKFLTQPTFSTRWAAIEELTKDHSSLSPVNANREICVMLKDGVLQVFRHDALLTQTELQSALPGRTSRKKATIAPEQLPQSELLNQFIACRAEWRPAFMYQVRILVE